MKHDFPPLTEAIILAGGLGTRLRDAVPELPKCMAPVAGKPFLFYVINYLRSQGISRFIFSLGYRSEFIIDYLKKEFATLDYVTVIEDEPLGTGGAIMLSLEKAVTEDVVVTNGDTLFKVDLWPMYDLHMEKKAGITIALKPMQNFDRYGAVALGTDNMITAFHEKKFMEEGLINGGIYVINRQFVIGKKLPAKFSFEHVFFEQASEPIAGYVSDSYFIDIGIPEDFKKANKELQKKPLEFKEITKEWTAFIDRDGVLNPEKENDYIRNLSEFKFYDDVPAAMKILADKFGRIVLVSNQRGIGKKLMTEGDIAAIHEYLLAELAKAGGRIDRIYYSTDVDDNKPDRKPNPGMAFKAAREIPGIDMNRALMIGNKPSDMKFGRNAGIYTIFLATTDPQVPFPHPDIDFRFNSLADFAKAL